MEHDLCSGEGLAIGFSTFVLLHFLVVAVAHSLVFFGGVASKGMR